MCARKWPLPLFVLCEDNQNWYVSSVLCTVFCTFMSTYNAILCCQTKYLAKSTCLWHEIFTFKEMLAVEFEVKLELVFFLSLNFCELSFIFFPFVCTSKLLLTDTLFSCFVHIISQENSLDNLKKCSSTVFHMFHVEVHRIKQKT